MRLYFLKETNIENMFLMKKIIKKKSKNLLKLSKLINEIEKRFALKEFEEFKK